MAEDLKHKTKVGMYWTFFNSASTQIMQFVVGIIMARLLSPEDYGITALPAVFMAIAGVFMDGGFGQALVRKEMVSDDDLSTSFFYSFGMGILMYLVMFCLSPYIADFYNTPILTPLIRVTALGFIWGPLGTVQGIILKRKLDFKTPARISIIKMIIGSIVGISAAYAGYGVWALVLSGLVSGIIGLVLTWGVVKWVPKAKFNKNSFKYLWNYGNKLIGANLIDITYNNVAPVVIGKFYSPSDLGVFNRANGYAQLPVSQISNILAGVTFPILSKMSSDIDRLAVIYRKMMKMTGFISFPVLFLLCALARPLVIVLLSEKWESCVVMLQIMCIARMWHPLMVLNRSALQVTKRTDLYLKMEVIKRAVNFILMCVSLRFGIIAFCCYQIVETVIAMCFNTHYTGKLLGVGLITQTMDVCKFYILSLIMFFLVIGINSLIDNMLLQIIVGGMVGVTFYATFSYIFRFEELKEVRYMLDKSK